MSIETICCVCGTTEGVSLWIMGRYRTSACENCGRHAPELTDILGNRPEKYDDIQTRRFLDGLADMAKILTGGGET